MRVMTHRQERVLECIRDFVAEHGYSPTLRDLGNRMSITSTNGVRDHLKALARRGLVTWDRNKARSIRVTKLAAAVSLTDLAEIRSMLQDGAEGSVVLAVARLDNILRESAT